MDYDMMDYENPFDGMDYDEILAWAANHQDELIEYGIDPAIIGQYLSREDVYERHNAAPPSAFPTYATAKAQLEVCAPNVLLQAAQTFYIPLLLSIAIQLLSRSGIPVRICHLFSLASGLVVLAQFHSVGLCLFSLAFCLFWLNVAVVAPKMATAYALPAAVLVAEFYIGPAWSVLRGPMLVFILKFLSLILSTDFALNLDNPDEVFQVLGYFYHPATLIFGPWIPLLRLLK